MLKRILWAMAGCLLMAGCIEDTFKDRPDKGTTNTDPENVEYDDVLMDMRRNRLNGREAMLRAEYFYKFYYGSKPQNDYLEGDHVAEVIPITYQRMTSGAIDTALYAVNLRGNQGFMLLPSDKRMLSIYAMVEEGAFPADYKVNDGTSAEVLNSGMHAFIASIVYILQNNVPQLLFRENFKHTGMDATERRVEGTIATQWGQLRPYGNYCPNSISGSIATAMSQLSYHLNYPKHATYYTSDGFAPTTFALDWNKIRQLNEQNHSQMPANDASEATISVAQLMRYWGSCAESSYQKNYTRGSTPTALLRMIQDGVNITVPSGFDYAQMERSINRNGILLMYLNEFYFSLNQYAWLADGYLKYTSSNEPYLLLRCNWGWGGTGNGFYSAEVMDVMGGTYYYIVNP